jgi:hypothetical protein
MPPCTPAADVNVMRARSAGVSRAARTCSPAQRRRVRHGCRERWPRIARDAKPDLGLREHGVPALFAGGIARKARNTAVIAGITRRRQQRGFERDVDVGSRGDPFDEFRFERCCDRDLHGVGVAPRVFALLPPRRRKAGTACALGERPNAENPAA